MSKPTGITEPEREQRPPDRSGDPGMSDTEDSPDPSEAPPGLVGEGEVETGAGPRFPL